MSEKVLIVTFDNVTDAMAMEEAAEGAHLTGKLIPLPDELSAGCGYAWKHDLSEREQLEALIRSETLDHEKILEWER
ncbi:MAG: DUF3343 domain-containing protein [Peptoniphilus sp.]|nr:DUF3343 domain-containing protein [Peptoniphilus sp.]MDD7363005.1 DUF3343 domain-containing protein [Bacillota bacterium]MDY6045270.1 DUF3343 domain-containing protein [Peptoniphilus sp.]